MSAQDIREKTLSFLEQFVSVDVEDDEDLFASGLVNSLFAMQLVLFVEKEFAIKVENQDLDIANFRSVNAITSFIQQKTA
ncbi:phosphopantetheine-binding protein [Sphaerotilus sp.]|uniref:acyl carrier protein n=1 Tax=Sphaerotilus sp. TaxID=2093942 RepID=UPI00286E381B|nr:phosphopantetheine-binding protein [Sphaerotilus sp.]